MINILFVYPEVVWLHLLVFTTGLGIIGCQLVQLILAKIRRGQAEEGTEVD